MPIYDIERSIGFLLAKAHQRGWGLFSEQIASYDLTPPQFSLLAFLWQQDGLTQAELSERSQIDRTTICGLVDRMERAGLLLRADHPKDRRANLIYLTEKGKQLEPELGLIANRVLEQFTARLSEPEKEQLIYLLDILRNGGDQDAVQNA